jgi:hypothetical protein
MRRCAVSIEPKRVEPTIEPPARSTVANGSARPARCSAIASST